MRRVRRGPRPRPECSHRRNRSADVVTMCERTARPGRPGSRPCRARRGAWAATRARISSSVEHDPAGVATRHDVSTRESLHRSTAPVSAGQPPRVHVSCVLNEIVIAAYGTWSSLSGTCCQARSGHSTAPERRHSALRFETCAPTNVGACPFQINQLEATHAQTRDHRGDGHRHHGARHWQPRRGALLPPRHPQAVPHTKPAWTAHATASATRRRRRRRRARLPGPAGRPRRRAAARHRRLDAGQCELPPVPDRGRSTTRGSRRPRRR